MYASLPVRYMLFNHAMDCGETISHETLNASLKLTRNQLSLAMWKVEQVVRLFPQNVAD